MCIERIGEELSSEEAEIAAELMDSDGDGLLSLEDLVRLVNGANDEQKANDLKMAFKMYEDIEGCGYNSIYKMHSSMVMIKTPTIKQKKRVANLGDSNASAEIEACAACGKKVKN
ncbi:hypothetical protein L1987_46660 [Smallanthus sonchifolius]|uniref:Uncharacterized protein n=1 Tax=Smallanthus sonchifolius TaxID=185202 RepID=A0ACB9G1D1_9ASTR|nr:hypothetical protein L1987_46660 [Smallanthus sonchifolius]